MMKTKYGFKTFIQSRHPLPKMPRISGPFDKAADLNRLTQGLWCYVTERGMVSKRPKPLSTNLIFVCYEIGGRARVYLPQLHRYTTISLESIHLEDELRPVSYHLDTDNSFTFLTTTTTTNWGTIF